MAVPYGNSVYGPQDMVAEKQLVRPAPLAEQLQSILEQLHMAHDALNEIEGTAQPNNKEMPGGIFDTSERACDSAMKLRHRVQELAARLGRL